MPELPIENSHFVRNVVGPIIVDGPADHRPDAARELPNARRSFYRPALPKGFKDDKLTNAHSAVDVIRDDLRRKVDAIWQSEPNVGVVMTAQQKHAWRKAEVKRVVDDELAARLRLVKPIVESATKELGKRREKLTAKGSVKLEGIGAHRAMQLVDHLARLDPEIRALRVLEAMNATDADSKELLSAIAWSNPNLDLVAPETRRRIQAVLVTQADPTEYSNLTTLDGAISSTSESLDNLERWAASLPDEYHAHAHPSDRRRSPRRARHAPQKASLAGCR